MLSNCPSTRCFLGPEGILSSREAKVRFPTDYQLKTNSREAEQGHIHSILGENRKSTLTRRQLVGVQRKQFLGQQLVPAYAWWGGEGRAVCARTHLARWTGCCFSKQMESRNVTSESKMYIA